MGGQALEITPFRSPTCPLLHRRTFKYLMGLASGVWVVQEAWAEAVTRQHGAQVRPVDEREYLVRAPGGHWRRGLPARVSAA